MAERELPEEIIEMMRKRWREIGSSIDHEESDPDPKKGKYTHHRCENCHCYRCCRHSWICQHCSVKKEMFHKWTNQDRQERERGEREQNMEGVKEERIVEEEKDQERKKMTKEKKEKVKTYFKTYLASII